MPGTSYRRLLLIALALLPARLGAQQHVEVPAQLPRPEDVASIDGIIKAFYDVISGPAGQPRQWGRDRTLYIPDVRFVSMSLGKDGRPRAQVMSHQQFVDRSDAGLVKQGFYERELGRSTRSFGNVTQVMSSYEMRQQADGPVIGRGVNLLQLYYDGSRWWIAAAQWDDEREGLKIPAELGG